jgi:hypothetical protein
MVRSKTTCQNRHLNWLLKYKLGLLVAKLVRMWLCLPKTLTQYLTHCLIQCFTELKNPSHVDKLQSSTKNNTYRNSFSPNSSKLVINLVNITSSFHLRLFLTGQTCGSNSETISHLIWVSSFFRREMG